MHKKPGKVAYKNLISARYRKTLTVMLFSFLNKYHNYFYDDVKANRILNLGYQSELCVVLSQCNCSKVYRYDR